VLNVCRTTASVVTAPPITIRPPSAVFVNNDGEVLTRRIENRGNERAAKAESVTVFRAKVGGPDEYLPRWRVVAPGEVLPFYSGTSAPMIAHIRGAEPFQDKKGQRRQRFSRLRTSRSIGLEVSPALRNRRRSSGRPKIVTYSGALTKEPWMNSMAEIQKHGHVIGSPSARRRFRRALCAWRLPQNLHPCCCRGSSTGPASRARS